MRPPSRPLRTPRGHCGIRHHEQEAPAPAPPTGRPRGPGPEPRAKPRSPDPGEADADPVDIADAAGDPEVERLAQLEVDAETDREDRVAVVAEREADHGLKVRHEAEPSFELDTTAEREPYRDESLREITKRPADTRGEGSVEREVLSVLDDPEAHVDPSQELHLVFVVRVGV